MQHSDGPWRKRLEYFQGDEYGQYVLDVQQPDRAGCQWLGYFKTGKQRENVYRNQMGGWSADLTMNVKAPEASLEQELDIFLGVYTNKWISIQGDESEEESKSDRLLFFEEWPEGALSDYTKSKTDGWS